MNAARPDGLTLAGTGLATSFAAPAEGPLREVTGPEDVLLLTDEIDRPDWVQPVILIHEAGGTTVGPLLGSIAGVVSTMGTLGAHVALLSKEFGCPCIVGMELFVPPEDLGCVRMESDGSLWSLPSESDPGGPE